MNTYPPAATVLVRLRGGPQDGMVTLAAGAWPVAAPIFFLESPRSPSLFDGPGLEAHWNDHGEFYEVVP